MTELSLVAGVRAIDDRRDARAVVHDRHRVRQVDGVVAVAPGVERVAVAGDAADHAFGLGALGGRERGKVQARGGGVVEDHLGEAAGAGHHRNSPAAGPTLALAHRQHLAHLVEVAHLDRAMRLQHFREHPRFPGEPAGMARDRALRALRASHLEHDHRLSGGGGAVERGDVALGLAHRLGERRDHLGGGIVDEIFEIVDRSGDSFVAGRDGEADAEPAQIREKRDAHRAALRNNANVAGKSGGLHHVLLVGGHTRGRIEDAHAVRPAHSHARLAA